MQGQMGLPTGYGEQMFTNLQATNEAQRKANQQRIMDNTRNPAMSGMTQSLVAQNNQSSADQGMQARGQAEMAGAQAKFGADQAAQGRAFQNDQLSKQQQFAWQQMIAQQRAAQDLQAAGFSGQKDLAAYNAALNII